MTRLRTVITVEMGCDCQPLLSLYYTCRTRRTDKTGEFLLINELSRLARVVVDDAFSIRRVCLCTAIHQVGRNPETNEDQRQLAGMNRHLSDVMRKIEL